jgi:NADH dehydrogenase
MWKDISMAQAQKKVLILGGGFGGAKAALELANDTTVSVTVLNDTRHLRCYPLLYQYVVGGDRSESFLMLPEMFAGKAIKLVIGKAVSLDKQAKQVTLEDGQVLSFDILILALGSVTNYFHIPGLEETAFAVKSLHEGQKLRQHLHQELMDVGKPELHYVVVGAGPTGVELSAALADYLKQIISHHHIPTTDWHIDLVEAADRVLPRSAEDVSAKVAEHLISLGIHLHLKATVAGATAEELTLADSSIKSKTIIWTAGVATSPFYAANAAQFAFNDKKRLVVDEYLGLGNDMYVIGDNAPTQFSGLAQTAISDGIFVAANIKRAIAGKPLQKYVAHEPVYATPAGEGWAAIQWGKRRYYGRLGWWIRRLADLVAYRDLLPESAAWKLWLGGGRKIEDCPVCNGQIKA